MGMFKQVKRSVNSILPRLFGDEDLVTEVTWKVFTSSTFNESTGVNEDQYEDSELTAIRIDKDIGSSNAGKNFPPGPFAMSTGEVQYLFESGEVPDGASIRDVIVDGSLVYNVKRIVPIFDLITRVEVKGYA
jgi:hypothetical protein